MFDDDVDLLVVVVVVVVVVMMMYTFLSCSEVVTSEAATVTDSEMPSLLFPASDSRIYTSTTASRIALPISRL